MHPWPFANFRVTADVPILALTANCADQVREQCREAGMQGFLSKPVDANELWATVTEYLKREAKSVLSAATPANFPPSLS